MGRPREPTKY
jgi:hypothetical protein